MMPLPAHIDRETFLDALVGQLPMGVFCNDATGACIYLSRRCCEITGLTETSGLGEGWAEALHPDDSDRVVAAWSELLDSGTFEESYRFVHPDGTVRWVVGRGDVLREPDGTPAGIVGTIEDVTELHEVAARYGSTEVMVEAILRNTSDLVVVVDGDGTLVFVSEAAKRILGREPEHWVGRSVFDLLHPDDIGMAAEAMVTSIEGEAGVKEALVLRIADAEGRWRSVEIVANNLSEDPRVGGLVISVRDLTERLQAREAAERDRRRFEQVFERAPIGMALVSNRGEFLRVNAALCEILGRSAAELLRSDLFEFIHPADRRRGLQHALEVLEGRSADPIEARFQRRNGETAWARVSSTVVREEGRALHSIVHIEDVTEQRELRDQLEVAATHDPLTGVLNRNGLYRLFDQGGYLPGAGALVSIDLDRFKAVNDEFGHAAGDELLELVALRIRMAIRAEDSLARLGGDEFIVIVSDHPEPGLVEALAERIRVLLEAPFELSSGVASISGSIGVKVLPVTPEFSEELADADSATYRAKSLGGNRVELIPALWPRGRATAAPDL
jgi:diguanylate cyclase (GGDEF)-like protein/PAS domain S-box-containing protein